MESTTPTAPTQSQTGSITNVNLSDANAELKTAESYYKQNENSLMVVVEMGVGLDEVDYSHPEFSERFPATKKKSWCPTQAVLIAEIVRRKEILRDRTKFNRQSKKAGMLDWLKKNPVFDIIDKTFITDKIESFLSLNERVEKEKKQQWAGIAPRIRFIHCMFDNDNVKETLLKSFCVLTRAELDAKNSPEQGQVCAIQSIYIFMNFIC